MPERSTSDIRADVGVCPEPPRSLDSNRCAITSRPWHRDWDPPRQALSPEYAGIRAVHDDPILLGRRHAAKYDHRLARPGEGAVQSQTYSTVGDVTPGDVAPVHADRASGGNIDHGVVEEVLFQFDAGHPAASAPVKTAHARLAPVPAMRPVLRRRDRKLGSQRGNSPLQLLRLAGGPVIVQEDVAGLTLPRVRPLGIRVLRGEPA